jgi:DNA-binding MarR family transcriptional regulator
VTRPGRHSTTANAKVAAQLSARLEALFERVRPSLTELSQLQEFELTPPQFVTLMILSRTPTLTVSAIAEQLGLSRAATSHLVNRLVQRRLLRRTEDTVDRRQRQVEMEAAGRVLMKTMETAKLAAVEQLVADLSVADRTSILRALDDVLERLAKADPKTKADRPVDNQAYAR